MILWTETISMTDRVLVPYDGSEQSDLALAYALEAFPADEIVLLHVIEPYTGTADLSGYSAGHYERERENAETLLENALETHEVSQHVETDVTYGRAVHEILGYTDDNGIDHVVVGSHGRDGATRLLLGSVAETVVRRAPVPTTVVRKSQQSVGTPEHVLVAYDGSTHSRRALSYAFDRFEEAAITALYVLFPPIRMTTGTTGQDDVYSSIDEWEENRDDYANSVLEGAQELADEHDRTLQSETVEGEPADAIVEFAEKNDVDHLVVGSTGRDGLSRLLLGSVAEKVVRRSPVSVTVAK